MSDGVLKEKMSTRVHQRCNIDRRSLCSFDGFKMVPSIVECIYPPSPSISSLDRRRECQWVSLARSRVRVRRLRLGEKKGSVTLELELD